MTNEISGVDRVSIILVTIKIKEFQFVCIPPKLTPILAERRKLKLSVGYEHVARWKNNVLEFHSDRIWYEKRGSVT